MGVVSVPASAAPASAARLPPKAYYALTILTALNVINVWHRYLIVSVQSVLGKACTSLGIDQRVRCIIQTDSTFVSWHH